MTLFCPIAASVMRVLPSIRKHGSYSVQSKFADLSPQLQVLIQMETRQKQIEARQTEQATALAGLEQKIQNTCEVIALDKTAWRKDSEHLINKIAREPEMAMAVFG